MFNDVIADCFVFSSFYFFPANFFQDFPSCCWFWQRCKNVTHFRRNAPTKKQNKKQIVLTEQAQRFLIGSSTYRMSNYRRKETKGIAIEELFFSFQKYAKCSNLARFEQVEFHSVHAVRRTPSERSFLISNPIGVTKTSYSQIFVLRGVYVTIRQTEGDLLF